MSYIDYTLKWVLKNVLAEQKHHAHEHIVKFEDDSNPMVGYSEGHFISFIPKEKDVFKSEGTLTFRPFIKNCDGREIPDDYEVATIRAILPTIINKDKIQAIELEMQSNRVAYIDEKFYKIFEKDAYHIYVKSENMPVLIENENHQIIGLIMPIKFRKKQIIEE